MEIFRRIAWLRGRGEESVVANKRAKLRQLNANGEMGGGGWGVGGGVGHKDTTEP